MAIKRFETKKYGFLSEFLNFVGDSKLSKK